MRKHTSRFIAAAISAAVILGITTSCVSQTNSTNTADTTFSLTTPAENQTPSSIDEVKAALANVPSYQSVTMTEKTLATFKDNTGSGTTSSEPSTIGSETVYKFDASSGTLKTFMSGETSGITLKYYSEGTNAVCVTDGPVYSGTTEQFEMSHFAGADAYIKDTIGDLNTIADCADTVTKGEQGDLTVYTITVNVDKYVKTDEILTMMAESDDPVLKAVFTVGFNKEGRMVLVTDSKSFKKNDSELTETLTDFDTTVIDPMPAADKTYEQMEADIDAKLDEFVGSDSSTS